MSALGQEKSDRLSTQTSARGPRLLVALAALIVLGWSILWWPYTIDDAYIVYRYAQHVVAGIGPVFNAGELVEGYSCPSWMFLLAGFAGTGADIVVSSKILGLLCAVLIPFLAFAILRAHCRNPLVAAAAAIWVAVIPELHIYACSGMETVPFAAAVAAAVFFISRRPQTLSLAFFSLVSLLAVLTLRPEGLLLSSVLLCVVMAAPMTRRARWVLLCFIPLMVLMFALRWSFYGALLPNTYLAKPSPFLHEMGHTPPLEALRLGTHTVLAAAIRPAGFLICSGTIVLLPLLWLGAVKNRFSPIVQACLVAMAVGLVFTIYYPVDWMPGLRLTFPFFLPTFVLCALGIDQLLRGHDKLPSWLRHGIPLTVLVLWSIANCTITLGWLTKYRHNRVNKALNPSTYVDMGRWLRAHASPDDTVLAFEIGAVGYYSHLRIIDHEGLIDPYIAGCLKRAGGYGPVRSGQDSDAMMKVVQYCVERRPTWFLARSFTTNELTVGREVPLGVCQENIQNALLEKLGSAMVLEEVFPLEKDGLDKYLLLRRKHN